MNKLVNTLNWLALSIIVLYAYVSCKPATADEYFDDSILPEPVCVLAEEAKDKAEYEAKLSAMLFELSVEVEMERLRLERVADAIVQ